MEQAKAFEDGWFILYFRWAQLLEFCSPYLKPLVGFPVPHSNGCGDTFMLITREVEKREL